MTIEQYEEKIKRLEARNEWLIEKLSEKESLYEVYLNNWFLSYFRETEEVKKLCESNNGVYIYIEKKRKDVDVDDDPEYIDIYDYFIVLEGKETYEKYSFKSPYYPKAYFCFGAKSVLGEITSQIIISSFLELAKQSLRYLCKTCWCIDINILKVDKCICCGDLHNMIDWKYDEYLYSTNKLSYDDFHAKYGSFIPYDPFVEEYFPEAYEVLSSKEYNNTELPVDEYFKVRHDIWEKFQKDIRNH